MILLRAEESLFADRAVSLIRKNLLKADPGTEISTVEAATYESGQLAVAVSPSLFAESRFVYIPQVEQANTALVEDLLKYVTTPEPQVVILLRHNGGNSARKLLTELQNLQVPAYIAPKLANDGERIKCVIDEARSLGGRIDNDAAAALVLAMRSELPEILAVVSQLVSDYPGEVITANLVEEYQAGKREVDGYEVVQAAIDGDLATALTHLRHALSCGVTGPSITGAMAFKLRQLAKVSTIPRRTAYEMGMAPFMVQKTQGSLRTWNEMALREAFRACAIADAEVKGESRDPVYALEKLLITVARRGSKF
ncbi:putative DNA polymerase III, delta subunit [Gleimia coleocanis DSM 15436]|uniref:DNA-directed DNA polymerase n=1 Tax=Gleimia coleocanis DSM 15436 TaxID=525245 RepID=C0W076_9ACTO|nr:putative DNA polymerase III, delta subunit [Gleimia coleocanis DSM 15436]